MRDLCDPEFVRNRPAGLPIDHPQACAKRQRLVSRSAALRIELLAGRSATTVLIPSRTNSAQAVAPRAFR